MTRLLPAMMAILDTILNQQGILVLITTGIERSLWAEQISRTLKTSIRNAKTYPENIVSALMRICDYRISRLSPVELSALNDAFGLLLASSSQTSIAGEDSELSKALMQATKSLYGYVLLKFWSTH